MNSKPVTEKTIEMFEEAINNCISKGHSISENQQKIRAAQACMAIHKSECVKLLQWFDGYECSPEYYEAKIDQYFKNKG